MFGHDLQGEMIEGDSKSWMDAFRNPKLIYWSKHVDAKLHSLAKWSLRFACARCFDINYVPADFVKIILEEHLPGWGLFPL